MGNYRSILKQKSIANPDVLTISEATFRALSLTSRAVFRMLEADGEARIVPDAELPSLPGKKQESAGGRQPPANGRMLAPSQEGYYEFCS